MHSDEHLERFRVQTEPRHEKPLKLLSVVTLLGAAASIAVGCVEQKPVGSSLSAVPSADSSATAHAVRASLDRHGYIGGAMVWWPSAASDSAAAEGLFGAEHAERIGHLRSRIPPPTAAQLREAAEYSERRKLVPFTFQGKSLTTEQQLDRAALIVWLRRNEELLKRAQDAYTLQAATLALDDRLYLCDKVDVVLLARHGFIVFTRQALGAIVLKKLRDTPEWLFDVAYPGTGEALTNVRHWPETKQYCLARFLQTAGERNTLSLAQAEDISDTRRTENSVLLVDSVSPSSYFNLLFEATSGLK